jgi:hypothetical protein
VYVEFRAGTYLDSKDVERAGGNLKKAVEDLLGINVDKIDFWTYETNEEYEEADTPGSILFEMEVD